LTAQITVVGLGSGDENQLSLGIWKKLQSAGQVYVRTEHHPVIGYLRQNGIEPVSFDEYYTNNGRFEDVYETIADRLIAEAASFAGEIVYAVPGHPRVAERTTRLLEQRCPASGIAFAVMGGESFLDQAFLRFGFDPIEGFQLLDAADLRSSMLNPLLHTVIGQVYDGYTASDVKLAMMEVYPDDYPVTVGHSLGIEGDERIVTIPLYELDRQPDFGNLSLVWVPRSDDEQLRMRSFSRLHEIVAVLRSPEGCPWDREQTHLSIRKNLIEETYEVLETIDDDDPDAMREEMGDLMLQIMLHSQMEEEAGSFNVYDVIGELNAKLIRRHPHVFGDKAAGNAAEALVNWEQVKKEEKRNKGLDMETQSALAGVPRDIPALMKAWKLQKKAAQVGFDWDRMEDVLSKVEEELDELKAEIELPGQAEHADTDLDKRKAELGDVLFSIVNLARFLKIDPEEALAMTNRKFVQRFAYIEERVRLSGKKLVDTGLEEMESYWREAKKNWSAGN
jgi:tetrapyrrole methylase family protein/MazG family protein